MEDKETTFINKQDYFPKQDCIGCNEYWGLLEENKKLKAQIDEVRKYIDESTTAFVNFTKVECGLSLSQTKDLKQILDSKGE